MIEIASDMCVECFIVVLIQVPTTRVANAANENDGDQIMRELGKTVSFLQLTMHLKMTIVMKLMTTIVIMMMPVVASVAKFCVM